MGDDSDTSRARPDRFTAQPGDLTRVTPASTLGERMNDWGDAPVRTAEQQALFDQMINAAGQNDQVEYDHLAAEYSASMQS